MCIKVTDKLRDTAAIVVSDELYKDFAIAVVNSKIAQFPACIVSADHPDVKLRIRRNEIYITRKILEITREDPEDLDIKFFPAGYLYMGLFYQHTLLLMDLYVKAGAV